MLAHTGRGGSVYAEPGLRTAGVGTLSALASWGTRRKRAVWFPCFMSDHP